VPGFLDTQLATPQQALRHPATAGELAGGDQRLEVGPERGDLQVVRHEQRILAVAARPEGTAFRRRRLLAQVAQAKVREAVEPGFAAGKATGHRQLDPVEIAP